MRLSDLESGEKGRVTNLQGEANLCSRLREMGFCESAVVEKVSGNYTLLCQVCGTRVALNGQVAKNIVVEKID
jgi:ferrous iron transport protein A